MPGIYMDMFLFLELAILVSSISKKNQYLIHFYVFRFLFSLMDIDIYGDTLAFQGILWPSYVNVPGIKF